MSGGYGAAGTNPTSLVAQSLLLVHQGPYTLAVRAVAIGPHSAASKGGKPKVAQRQLQLECVSDGLQVSDSNVLGVWSDRRWHLCIEVGCWFVCLL